MAYSNTNRDKVQAKSKTTVKTMILMVGLMIIIVSSLLNIYNQWSTLHLAVKRNWELEQKIEKLEIENKQMLRQIEYATSSANIERKAREYLGLGRDDDHWLIMPDEKEFKELVPEINETTEKQTIIQWWDMFIK